jgi:nucleoside-diphosphate-sugar epimerase
MKALVTGGTGCVGSALVERLVEKGYSVRALVRKTSDLSHLKTTGADLAFGDVENHESLPPAVDGVDIVFHAAAKVTPGWGTWEEFEKTTVKGTQNLLQASSRARVRRFLQVSSYTVYEPSCRMSLTPVDESTPCSVAFTPDTYYDYAKLLAEQACWEFHKDGKIQVSMIRIGSVYGPRDRLLADRIYRYVAFPVVLWPGKVDPRYAVVHASDIADLAILAATSDKAIGQAYNAAPPEPIRLKAFAEAMIRAQGGRRIRGTMPYSVAYVWCALMEAIARLRRAKEMPFLNRYSIEIMQTECCMDGSKARLELGWAPMVSADEGTRQYVEWRRAHDHAGKKQTARSVT